GAARAERVGVGRAGAPARGFEGAAGAGEDVLGRHRRDSSSGDLGPARALRREFCERRPRKGCATRGPGSAKLRSEAALRLRGGGLVCGLLLLQRREFLIADVVEVEPADVHLLDAPVSPPPET